MLRIRFVAAAVVIVSSACGGGGEPALVATTAPTASSGSVSDTSETPDTLAADFDELEPPPVEADPVESEPEVSSEEQIAVAVVELAEMESYALTATITVSTATEIVETVVDGWVQGDEYVTVLRVGTSEVVTAFVDGTVRVTRDGKAVSTPASEPPDAEPLNLVRALSGIGLEGADSLSAKLIATAMRELGFDVEGSARLTVTLGSSGRVGGYTLEGAGGAWVVETHFSGFGDTFWDN